MNKENMILLLLTYLNIYVLLTYHNGWTDIICQFLKNTISPSDNRVPNKCRK